MKPEQQTNSAGDVLANAGDSLREWAPAPDEERRALDRVWTGLRWKANKVPAEAVRSVRLQLPEVPGVPRVRRVPERRSMVRVAAAAALVIVAVGGAIVWPRGARVYAAGNDGLQVTLSDDSRVEMRAHAEMAVARASDGIQIDLKTGDIIVTAAKQRGGHLSVRTKDFTVAVEGTVFLANADQQGSRVGVIEGEVRVREEREGSVETRLRPGEQMASLTIAPRSLAEDIAWSRNADVHRAVIDSFMKGVAQSRASLTPLARQADVNSAQTPGANAAALEFEEASIRPCDPNNLPAAVPGARGGGGANSVYMTPGRLYVLCMTPATMIRTAYGYFSVDQEVELGRLVNPEAPGRMRPISANSVYGAPAEDGRRVRGGPDWVRTERYTIEAVAGGLDPKNDVCAPLSIGGRTGGPPGPPSPNRPCSSANAAAMSRPMLLALLERRFGLKAHIVTEQTTAYNLVIAPGGLKMKEGACTPDPQPGGVVSEEEWARRLMEPVRRSLAAARRGDVPPGPCGRFGGHGMADNGPNRILVSEGARVPGLVQTLERILGTQVIDRTGIPGASGFTYALEFVLDDRTRRNPWRAIATDLVQIAADPSSVPPAPNLFTALEQQLGLRLEPTQVPRDYIVIDAIKRLDPN